MKGESPLARIERVVMEESGRLALLSARERSRALTWLEHAEVEVVEGAIRTSFRQEGGEDLWGVSAAIESRLKQVLPRPQARSRTPGEGIDAELERMERGAKDGRVAEVARSLRGRGILRQEVLIDQLARGLAGRLRSDERARLEYSLRQEPLEGMSEAGRRAHLHASWTLMVLAHFGLDELVHRSIEG